MKRKYMKPFTEVVIVNHENLLFDDWHSTQLDGTLPDGTEVGNGGDGEEDDIELSKKSFWDYSYNSKEWDSY